MIKKILVWGSFICVVFYGCSSKETKPEKKDNLTPLVSNNGITITFPGKESIVFFETDTIGNSDLNTKIIAPAKVSATVIKSSEGASQNIILFENPELAGNYTQLIQHLINIKQIENVIIKQRQTELSRIKDLQEHGAATGKDLLEAQSALSVEQTNLANERTAIIEHETKLKAGGFEPQLLRKAKAGAAYIICDIPENQISRVKQGSNCIIEFTAFPNEKFNGKIDDVADMVDNTTRMIKLRVSIDNANGKLKAGMFATVSFGISEDSRISIDKNSLVTIQSINYVFVKTSATVFERKEVTTGNQVGDRIIIYNGLKTGDIVAVKGVMQLKGLSFGY